MNNNVILKKRRRSSGQAIIEYLLVFAMLSFIGIKLVGYIKTFFGNTVGGLGVELTRQLSSGVCPNNCFFRGYKNEIQ